MAQQPVNIEQLLGDIAEAEHDREQVSMDRIMTCVGRRSFGPILLLAGILLASPLSGVPGFPTLMAAVVLLICGQMLLGRQYFWLPDFLLRRSVDRHKLDSVRRWLEPPARFIDRLLKPRLTRLVDKGGAYFIAVICALVAAALPVLELVPLSSTGGGVVFLAFGLALVARDGALALVGIAAAALTAAIPFL